MTREATITTDQLHAVFLGTELSGRTELLDRFSYAEKGASTYSFGVLQFDVGNNARAQEFLGANGFTADDIALLSQRGGLSSAQLEALNAKLQAIPEATVAEFTNQNLERSIDRVDDAIAAVRARNPAAADAIVADPELQLAMADYDNQFGSMGPQFISYLAGEQVTLRGGAISAGESLGRDDLQRFIDATKFGVENPTSVQNREERFERALQQLDLQAREPGTPVEDESQRTNGTWPAPGNRTLTTGGGGQGDGAYDAYRNHRDGDGHDGVDIRGQIGDPIVAFRSGTVISAGVVGGYGNMIAIRHDDGAVSRYAHLESMDVRAGQQVTEGQRIGAMGDSGNAQGLPQPHLHFEYLVNGRDVDPMPYLNGTARVGDATPQAMADGVLQNGDRGPEVIALQERLNALGYRGSNGQPLETTSGIYGPQTEHAVRAFQRANGLEVDGKAGRGETLPALEQASRDPLVSEATHPNHGLYAEVARRVAEQTGQPPRAEAVANITLQMLENGFRNEQDVRDLAVRGSDVHVRGPVPGTRVSVDLEAPTPDMRSMSEHMSREQTQRLQEQERQQQQSSSSPVMYA